MPAEFVAHSRQDFLRKGMVLAGAEPGEERCRDNIARNGFFDRCTPNTQTGCAGLHLGTATCPGGIAELAKCVNRDRNERVRQSYQTPALATVTQMIS